jgi:hypothetical protein
MPKDVLSLKISSNLMRVASSHQHEHRWFLRATAATSKPWRSMEFLQDLRFGLAAHCQTPLEKRSRPWTWSGLTCSPSSKTCLGGTRAEVTSSTGGGAPTPSSHRIRFFAPRSVLLPLLPLLPLLRFWRVSRCFMDLVSLLCLPVSARYSLIWGGGPKAKQEVEETLPVCT